MPMYGYIVQLADLTHEIVKDMFGTLECLTLSNELIWY